MINTLGDFANGLGSALTPELLLLALIGVTWGTLIGVLPGIGPVAGMALLLPFASNLDVAGAMIMLAAVYYGTMYGGAITSVLTSIPGETASVVTAIDGHQMSRNGRSGAALAFCAIASFIGGTVAVALLAVLAKPLATLALGLKPPDYFILAVVGVVCAAFMSSAPMSRSLFMIMVGLALATVGMDLISGQERFTFGWFELTSGINVVAVVIGLFGISELLDSMLFDKQSRPIREPLFSLRKLLPSSKEWRLAKPSIMRGAGIGFGAGMVPGGGGTLAAYASYALESRVAKERTLFGRGHPGGVAGPEAANNAGAVGALVPLLTLGIPYSVVTAIMLNTMTSQGVTPSPLLLDTNPDFFWTVVASMFIANLMLLVLNLPLVGVWASVLRMPRNVLLASIGMFCLVGVYADSFRIFDVWVALAAGVIGLILRRYDYPVAPMILSFILLPFLEQSFTQSMIIGHNSPLVFLQSPVSAGALAALVALFFVIFTRKRGQSQIRTTISSSSSKEICEHDRH